MRKGGPGLRKARSSPGGGAAYIAPPSAPPHLTTPTPPFPGALTGAGLEAAPLEQQLRRSLYLASRSADKRVAGTAWAAYTFLQRAAAASPDAACRAKVCGQGGVELWHRMLPLCVGQDLHQATC